MKGVKAVAFPYTSTWHAFQMIVLHEGVPGLYKGMLPNLLKVAPAMGITFVVYEKTKELLMHL